MKKVKPETPALDISGLLALKKYEHPDENRVEKNIQNTLRAVRSTSNIPSLLIFPDKSFAWMFAQPRYGIAALFVLFLGLHLLKRPMPGTTGSSVAIIKAPRPEIVATGDTNQLKAATFPSLEPPFSLAGEPPNPLSSYLK